MPAIIQGRIVWLDPPRPDPQGGNIKTGRKYIVISTRESIKLSEPLCMVAITSDIDGDEYEVLLPHSQHTNRGTGLITSSVAACHWIERDVPLSEVRASDNYVNPRELREILIKVADLANQEE